VQKSKYSKKSDRKAVHAKRYQKNLSASRHSFGEKMKTKAIWRNAP